MFVRRDGKEIVQIIQEDGIHVVLQNQSGLCFRTTVNSLMRNYEEVT